MVEKMAEEGVNVRLCCRVLGLSRSGFYAWKIRPESNRSRQNAAILPQVRAIHAESRGTYGLPRIQEKLRQQGYNLGKSRITHLMKSAEISGLTHRRFRVVTTLSNHNLPVAKRIFRTEEPATHPTRPNQVWASDISYILTGEGHLYLATYLDLFTRKVTGFAIEDHMRTELLLQALDMGLGRSEVLRDLVHHSDRGSQYASGIYSDRLRALGITASMSRKGNCYDNAFAESFFATLKKELVYRNNYDTKEEAKKAIFEYIEVWYNRSRLHSSLGYRTPIQFEDSYAA